MNPDLLAGFAGPIGAGKNSAASSIPRSRVIEHADPIYWMISAMLATPVDDLRDRGSKETPLVGIGKSVRDMLRSLGTEWGRELVHPDLWVNLANARIDQHLARGELRFAIPGVRFQNEIDAIRDRGGFVVWVDNPRLVPPASAPHKSDRMIGRDDCDVLIVNGGSLDDLSRAVETAILIGKRIAADKAGAGI